MDVPQQAEAGLVVHRVGDHQLGPALQWDVKRIGIAKGLRIPFEDQCLLAFAQLLEDVVGDVRVGQLILDDGDPGHEGVDAGRLARRQVVGRRRDQLGVAGDDQRVLELP